MNNARIPPQVNSVTLNKVLSNYGLNRRKNVKQLFIYSSAPEQRFRLIPI